jgi:hypothetical protein
MSSLSSPQAGQFALSTLLILPRYPLSGKYCNRSCAIWLGAFLDSFSLLIVLRKIGEPAVLVLGRTPPQEADFAPFSPLSKNFLSKEHHSSFSRVQASIALSLAV